MKKIVLLILFVFNIMVLTSQTGNLLSNYNYYRAFAVDSTNFYIGLVNGLVVQDRETNDFNYYTTINSELESNFISDIKIRDSKVYISTNDGLYLFKNDKLENLNVGRDDIREINFDSNGNLWTYDASYIFKYDGVDTEHWDVSSLINFQMEISKIDIVGDYIWVTMYQGYPGSNYYSNFQWKDYRFALFDIKKNSFKFFTQYERGFDFQNTISYQLVVKDEIWIGTGQEKNFIFDLKTKRWRTNQRLKITGANYKIANNYVVTDNRGDVWFSVYFNNIRNPDMFAFYSFKNDTIETRFNHLVYNYNASPYKYFSLGEYVLATDNKAFYLIKDERVEMFEKSLYSDSSFYSSHFYYFDDDIYFLKREWVDDKRFIDIVSLKENKQSKYKLLEKNTLKHPNVESYAKDDNAQFIEGAWILGTSYDDYFEIDGEWYDEYDLDYGYVSPFSKVSRLSNGDFTIPTAEGVYGVRNNEFHNYANDSNSIYRHEQWVCSYIYNDNIYVYSMQSVPDTDQLVYNTYVSVFNMNNEEIMVYDKSNSCLSDFEYVYVGPYEVVPKGPRPSDVSVDNSGNIWCMNNENLFVIESDMSCRFIEYFPKSEDGFLFANRLIYSKNKSVMYTHIDNEVYNLNSETEKKVNSYDIVGAGISYMGECGDGNVYLATDDGRLFVLHSLYDWQQIEIENSLDNIKLKITHISEFKDTLYLSTDLGVLKVKKPFISNIDSDNLNAPSQVDIYPNPSRDFITITNIDDDETIEIRTITGSVVLKSINEKRISIKTLSTGVYFVFNENCERLGKFIKE